MWVKVNFMSGYKHFWLEPKERAKKLYKEHGERVQNDLSALERVPNNLFEGDVTLEYFRTRFFKPVAKLFTLLGLNSNHVTTIGLLIACSALFINNGIILLFVISMNLLIDGIDGVVARYQNKYEDFGAWYDIFSDTVASMVFTYVTFTLYQPNKAMLYFLIILIPLQVFLSSNKNKILFGKPIAIGTRISSSAISIVLVLGSLWIDDISQLSNLYINGLMLVSLAVIFFNISHLYYLEYKNG
jgi:phosphatidylglycerophosphate synthase